MAPPDSVVVRTNYTDNPFFPGVLQEERSYDQAHKRERYAHIWLGEYEPAAIGAIWDRLTLHQGRVAVTPELERIVVAVDPAVSSRMKADGLKLSFLEPIDWATVLLGQE